MITLHDYELSGNCYKVRLLLNILRADYQKIPVEFYPAAEHKHDEFLAINPLGQLPVLHDDSLCIRDSHAILVYVASEYDKSGMWYPTHSAAAVAQVTQWMCFADALTATASAARLVNGFFYDLDADTCREKAHALFRILDEHLWYNERDKRHWIVEGTHPTIADIACFAYTMLSEEGGISRMDYPAIRRWSDRVKRIPGFIVMPGIFPAGPSQESSAQPVTQSCPSPTHSGSS
ncbi:MAG: glutathione S-transferase family protein [Granulosicoccus sp.]